MTEIIDLADLTAYPGVRIRNNDTAGLVLLLTNDLVSDVGPEGGKVGDLSPMPAKAKALALKVAARALDNPRNAELITKNVDDWKTTVQYRDVDPGEAGVYLTDAEETRLLSLVRVKARKRVGSIKLGVPGYARTYL
jgi:hypothetical protein